ncbi:hypothetical protein CLU94_3119 [Janthinobacterium sp. 13]|nr:hypothetical protein CLU94_3119 [Janthinobacterium sp. 13]
MSSRQRPANKNGPRKAGHLQLTKALPYSIAFTISSITFLASPNTIIVFA